MSDPEAGKTLPRHAQKAGSDLQDTSKTSGSPPAAFPYKDQTGGASDRTS